MNNYRTGDAERRSPELDFNAQRFGGLDSDEARVWQIVSQHRGRHAAIKAPELCAMTGLCERALRECVSRLVTDHGCPIGSGGNGFYVIEDPEELARVTRELHHRALSLLRRESKLRKVHASVLAGQLALELNDLECCARGAASSTCADAHK